VHDFRAIGIIVVVSAVEFAVRGLSGRLFSEEVVLICWVQNPRDEVILSYIVRNPDESVFVFGQIHTYVFVFAQVGS
jgi:hypothetical protein